MAKDDMQMIIYKILRYLYDAMKAGKRPKEEDVVCDCRLFSIPVIYWEQIIEEMNDSGFISGVRTVQTKGEKIFDLSEARITLKGVEYLEENTGMRKAAKVAGKAFEIVLSGIIAAL